ncbi:SDR family NAD(P)-dependent oxidoreductase [Flavobacterium reichenbachii]|uniref:NADP-dependent 3-hydroxy acid dehydrogenase YdfG n=1 Tax=Flavobacterium reichenbachii TaxID=362418 RepID=A0A085ZIN6_9FLAO|nr:SDR family oxidoreductase [Flavobacterium reichenbachii]KFF04300.1 AraC family transcriptional regulator [Flavobacterium reichenbachii]OXB11707.1 SDR family oxidoreductase [Flavobacterium reichenbachii]
MKTNNELGTAVVTGASSGLGKVFAQRLAARGYNLKLVARREEKLNELAVELRSKYGVTVTNLVADLSAPADLEKVAAALQNDTTITFLINNAGTSTLAPVTQTSIAKQKEMVDVNITALMLLSNAVLPGLIKRNEGTLINIGSVLGAYTLPVSSIYSGTKGFVVQYTRGLQEEVKGTNVKVQLVNPSITATEIWEVGGVPLSALDQAAIMTTEDCVDAALAGLDAGELATFPSVHNQELIDTYEEARTKLFTGSQTGKPAERYLQN